MSSSKAGTKSSGNSKDEPRTEPASQLSLNSLCKALELFSMWYKTAKSSSTTNLATSGATNRTFEKRERVRDGPEFRPRMRAEPLTASQKRHLWDSPEEIYFATG